MKQKMKLLIIILAVFSFVFIFFRYMDDTKEIKKNNHCLTGAFLGDRPRRKDIENFRKNYGKKPYLVMVFIDWSNFIKDSVYQDIFTSGSVPFITWEPWNAETKEGVDFNKILDGDYDRYIIQFAESINKFNRPVFLRFAHEANGNWYPWSGEKITAGTYLKTYRYIKKIFDNIGDGQIKWVFSINWEDLPSREGNFFMNYYPGPAYVDYFGIDGYNWGDGKEWSRWMEFREIFEKPYKAITSQTSKPILISEFSSAQSGGDKAEWIKNAFQAIKKMKKVKAFVLFNVDKEAAWKFRPNSPAGKQLKKELKDTYFRENR